MSKANSSSKQQKITTKDNKNQLLSKVPNSYHYPQSQQQPKHKQSILQQTKHK